MPGQPPPIPKPVLPHEGDDLASPLPSSQYITDDRTLLVIGIQFSALVVAIVAALSHIRLSGIFANVVLIEVIAWFFDFFYLAKIAKYLAVITSITAIASLGLLPDSRRKTLLACTLITFHAAFLVLHLLWLRHHLS